MSNIFKYILLTLFFANHVIANDYYICDCTSGADLDCIGGNDITGNGSIVNPWQSYEKARATFNGMTAGDTINFCKGGYWSINSLEDQWFNSSCLANNRCVLSDYLPDWATGDELLPILKRNNQSNMFSFVDEGVANHEEGYIIRNLKIIGSEQSAGLFFNNDIDDVLMDNLDISHFSVGVQVQFSTTACDVNDPLCDLGSQRLLLSNSRIVNNHMHGWLGGSYLTQIVNNYFADNGGSNAQFDHNIYLAGWLEDMQVIGNQLYHSSLDQNNVCQGTSLVAHGTIKRLLIENNTIWEDIGFAGNGCWGIAINTAYSDPELFEDIIIRGNTIRNVGNLAIGVNACTNCIIENNIVEQSQNIGTIAISAPNTSSGAGDAVMDNLMVRNNSIYINNADTAGTAIYVADEGDEHNIVSNVIYYNGNSSWFNCFETNLPNSAFNSIDNNICYHPQSASTEWFNGNGSLSNWQVQTGFDVNSSIANPGFINPTSSNFGISNINSIMVGTGHISLSSQTDILEHPRDTEPDIGAYEWIFDDLIFSHGFD